MDISMICPECSGTGVIHVGEGTNACGRCGGSGSQPFGKADSTELTKIGELVKKIYVLISKKDPKEELLADEIS